MKYRSNQGITKLKTLTNIKRKVMKQQFDLSLWLQDKSRKVVTRRGNSVRIICSDRKHGEDSLPVVFLENCNGGEFLLACRADGTCDNYDTPYDLFFAYEEEGLSEFEKELQTIISDVSHWTSDDGSISTYCYFGDKEIKKISGQILDLARKELTKNLPQKNDPIFELLEIFGEWLGKNGYSFKFPKSDTLKDLPKWKKATEHKEFAVHVCVMDEDMYPYLDTEVNEGEHYIELSDLKTLSKEE